MLDFAFPETPEEIQHQENWINRTLRDAYPGVSVCLHADRTTVILQPDTGEVPGFRTDCDYCPAYVVVLAGVVPHLMPWYFTPGPTAL
jgi:hypothetical protein